MKVATRKAVRLTTRLRLHHELLNRRQKLQEAIVVTLRCLLHFLVPSEVCGNRLYCLYAVRIVHRQWGLSRCLNCLIVSDSMSKLSYLPEHHLPDRLNVSIPHWQFLAATTFPILSTATLNRLTSLHLASH